MTDIVALFERYGELMKARRAATDPTERMGITFEMIQVKWEIDWSWMDFFAPPERSGDS